MSPYNPAYLCRRSVQAFLRAHAGRFYCRLCLIAVASKKPINERGAEPAVDELFRDPKPLLRMPRYICAGCGKNLPALGILAGDPGARKAG